MPADTRTLTIAATAGSSATPADGFAHFVHGGEAGLSRFHGTVTCLQVGPGGTVQLSGTVLDGATAAGIVIAGQDYAFTLTVGKGQQAFSLPRFAPAGALAPCGGGRPIVVPITQGLLRTAPG